jgi:hypothetical protein
MELWDETPTAAQAAVGVSVCGVIPAGDVPRRIGLVAAAVAAKKLATARAANDFMNLLRFAVISTRVATSRQASAKSPAAYPLRRNGN